MKEIGYPLRVSVNVTSAAKQRERSPQNGMNAPVMNFHMGLTSHHICSPDQWLNSVVNAASHTSDA